MPSRLECVLREGPPIGVGAVGVVLVVAVAGTSVANHKVARRSDHETQGQDEVEDAENRIHMTDNKQHSTSSNWHRQDLDLGTEDLKTCNCGRGADVEPQTCSIIQTAKISAVFVDEVGGGRVCCVLTLLKSRLIVSNR